MLGPRHRGASPAINEAVEAYESTRDREGQADLEAFLPEPDHAYYPDVLCELVRVDLEYSFEDNTPARLEDYERRFPQLFSNPECVQALAFEEYRLRLQAGETPSRLAYRTRYGVNCSDWPASDDGSFDPDLDEIPNKLVDPGPQPAPIKASTRARERTWAKRHPTLIITTIIVFVTLAATATVAAGLLARQARIDRLAANESLNRLTTQVKEAKYLLGVLDGPRRKIDEGTAICRKALEAYGAATDPEWLTRPAVAALGSEDRNRLRQGIGELLSLWAGVVIWKAQGLEETRAEFVSEAQRLTAAAERAYGPLGLPRAVRLQSADLAVLAGNNAEGQRLRVVAEAIPLRSAADRVLLVPSFLDQGQDRQALALCEDACRLDPGDFSVWLLRGYCLAQLGHDERADQCFGIAIDLHPSFGWAHIDRGLLALAARGFDRALADFNDALAENPNQPDALCERARAKLGKGDVRGAIGDLDRLLSRPEAPTRALFVRAAAHEALGNKVTALADRREGLARTPGDELSWIVRARNRLPGDPAAALDDFRSARMLNPNSLEALLNEAALLSDTLGRLEESIEALSQAVSYHPQSGRALASRSVLLAKVGRRDEAHRDAATALALNNSSDTLYSVACTFALLSKRDEADAAQALRLLALAIRKDASLFAKMDADPNLAPLRDRPDYRRLRDALEIVSAPAAAPK